MELSTWKLKQLEKEKKQIKKINKQLFKELDRVFGPIPNFNEFKEKIRERTEEKHER